MRTPDSGDADARIDRRTVLRGGVAGAGTIAVGSFTGATRVSAQEASEPESSDETPPAAGGSDDVTVGPDGVVLDSETPPGPITIFVARKIVTMNPSNPEATHVAV